MSRSLCQIETHILVDQTTGESVITYSCRGRAPSNQPPALRSPFPGCLHSNSPTPPTKFIVDSTLPPKEKKRQARATARRSENAVKRACAAITDHRLSLSLVIQCNPEISSHHC